MPKCVKCDQVFHPDMCVEVDEFSKACKCVFCYTEKQEITVTEEDGKPAYTVTKKMAIENYKVYLKKLSEDQRIQKAMMKGQDSPFKI
jgi:hypothetical protein